MGKEAIVFFSHKVSIGFDKVISIYTVILLIAQFIRHDGENCCTI